MENQLQVDVHFLVSYLEQLSLEIMITLKQNNKWGLGGLLLPRSWILRLIRGPVRSACRNPRISLLLEPIETLLSNVLLWNGTGAF